MEKSEAQINNQASGISPAKNKNFEEFRARLKGSIFKTESNRETAENSPLKSDSLQRFVYERDRKRANSAVFESTEGKLAAKQHMERIRGDLKTSPRSAIEGGGSPNFNSASLDRSSDKSPTKSTNDLETPSELLFGEFLIQLTDRKSSSELKTALQLVQIAEAHDLEEQASPKGEIRQQTVFFNSLNWEHLEEKKEEEAEAEAGIFRIYGTFENYYGLYEVLGEGTSGVVKRAVSLDDGKEYAVKITNFRGDEETVVLITKEFKNHRQLKHKNIVQVYELYIDELKNKIYSVLELARAREMFDVIHELGHYSEAVAANIFKQILLAIQYLHAKGVCHRDLKPNNILVSDDGSIVKITDFNVSKFIEDDKKRKYSGLSNENYRMWTYTGTVAFTAPEVFNETEYTEAVDMWSAGVVLYTMLCGYQPFQAEFLNDLIASIKLGKYEFNENPWKKISANAKALVAKLMNVNYKERFSPSEALAHQWILNEGGESESLIDETIQNLKSNVRKNAKNGISREPQSGLVRLRPHEKLDSSLHGNQNQSKNGATVQSKSITQRTAILMKSKSLE